MKKSLTKKVLVLLVMIIMASGAIFAIDLDVTGTVPNTLTLELDGSLSDGTYSAALLFNAATTWSNFATLTATTNNLGGYTISVNSFNDFFLVSNTVGSTSTIAYSLAATIPGTGATLTSDGDLVIASAQTDADGVDHLLTLVTVAPGSGAIYEAGAYEDTLTFTIANN